MWGSCHMVGPPDKAAQMHWCSRLPYCRYGSAWGVRPNRAAATAGTASSRRGCAISWLDLQSGAKGVRRPVCQQHNETVAAPPAAAGLGRGEGSFLKARGAPGGLVVAQSTYLAAAHALLAGSGG